MQQKYNPHARTIPSSDTTHLLQTFTTVPKDDQLSWVEMIPSETFAALDNDLVEVCCFDSAALERLTEAQLSYLCSLPDAEAVLFFYEVTGL